MMRSSILRRGVLSLAISAAALSLVGASRTPLTAHAAQSQQRAVISLKPGSITARDIASRSISVRHLALGTVSQFIGSGPIRLRPRATSATRGWLYFVEDVDGGALFRSNGQSWDQLTTGRLGRIARNSIDSSRIRPGGIQASRLADDSVTARAMSMDAWRAISGSGLLSARPDPLTRPAGSIYFATDDTGGTLYQNSGWQWLRVSSKGAAANITASSITGSLLAAGAVGARELANGAVGASALGAGAVGASALATGAVGSAQIADGAVALADIDPAVWADRLATGTLAGRPVASAANADSLYFATDDAGGTLQRSDGSTWTAVGRSRSHQIANLLFGTWTNMPAALSEMFGVNRSRLPFDLSAASEVRLAVNVTTVGMGSLCAQYSTDNGSTWFNFDGSVGSTCIATVAQVPITPVGLRTSPWTSIPVDARTETTLVRAVGIGGNGALDPVFGVGVIEFR